MARLLVSNISITSSYSGLTLGARRWQTGSETASRHYRILALHGWLDNAASFSRLAESLLLSGQCSGELVALDFPGHGRSDWRPGDRSHYVYPEYVADVVGVLDALRWDRDVILFGHSMGGGIALAATAVLGADKIAKTLLIEGLGPVSARAADTAASLRDAIAANMRFFAAGGHLHKAFPSADDAVEARKRATPYMSDAACRLIVERDCERQPDAPSAPGVYLSKDPTVKLRSLFRYTEDAVLDLISAVRSPIMLLSGTDPWMNTWITAEQAAERERVLRQTGCLHSSLVVENGHHHLHMEEDTLAKALPAILAFINDDTKPDNNLSSSSSSSSS